MTEDNFSEYRLKIIGDIARQNDSLMKLQDIVTALALKVGQMEIAEKVRSSLYGGISGFVAAASLIALAVMLEKIVK